MQRQTPIVLPLLKALQAACPMHDTQGTGDFGELSRAVVTEAHNPIVVA